MKIISSNTSNRVCNHMNKDHIESVYKYLIHYANISEFNEAFLDEITSKYMKIKYDNSKYAIINFKNEISEEEIHSTLVSMIRDIE